MEETINQELRSFLTGRIWLRMHIPFSQEQIDEHIQLGLIETISGISSKRRMGRLTHHCNRCENDDELKFVTFNCAKCKKRCTYCRNCLKMGRVTTCNELIYWIGEPQTYSSNHDLSWYGTLTPYQQKASRELQSSNKLGIPHLVHAVCGSGKTEILFEPIFKLLLEGKRVCIAAPRVDVVLELEPRLRRAFPKTSIEALYGGSESPMRSAQLILATTHQLYRFKQAFDVIFVDEADAFPYKTELTLQRAVQKAVKQGAPVHFITATPSDQLVSDMKKNGRISFINHRYHGKPLLVPRFEPLWNYEKHINKNILPKKLLVWTQTRMERKEPFLIFFPTIALLEKAEVIFEKVDSRIAAVHADHPQRKERVELLRDKKIPGLLTTTILERGITIPNVQVAVIGAEQSIFDKGALVQIGGRVGRSAQYPAGDFVLFHQGITYAMDGAKSEILRLNKGGVRA